MRRVLRNCLVKISRVSFRHGLLAFCLAGAFVSCRGTQSANAVRSDTAKPTLCILGGTPSSTEVLKLIPDSIRSAYRLISFNRPGFGASKNEKMTEQLLYKLAGEAGLKKNDFGVIGISGGAPFALLLATKFKLKHCGIISGMVSKEAFFKYADKAVTKGIMQTALGTYADFEATVRRFPNLDQIVKQAGASSEQTALRGCYDEFNFILSDNLFPAGEVNHLPVDWWHGEQDVNVPIESAAFFLKSFPNARFHRIAGANHGMDANVYLAKLLNQWNQSPSNALR